jgi:hypothetical protein
MNLRSKFLLGALAVISPFLAACSSDVAASDAVKPVSDAPVAIDSAKLPGLPWHMVNLWWKSPAIEDFRQFSIDVDLSQDVSAETYNLYISTLYGHINGEYYYGGIQTNVNGWDAMAPGDKKRLHGGHGFIFSRWSEKPTLSLDDVRATPGGFVEAAGYEGHFVSGRRPHPWKAGKYTFTLRRLDTQVVNGKPFTWVGGFVHEHATGKDIFISALRFAGDTLKHDGMNAAFVEFYATGKNSKKPDIAMLPPLVVKYSNLRFNGAPADLDKVSAKFIRKAAKRPDGLHSPISPNILHVNSSEDGREVTCTLVNVPFADAEEPNRTLWEKPKAATPAQ